MPYRCPVCGGIFDFAEPFHFEPDEVQPGVPGIWRYRHTFGLPTDAPVVTLGEGNTPLIWSQAGGKKVAFKLEYLNPSGSFKDRGRALLASFLLAHEIRFAVEDSSGNAGASFAAYSARAGITARVFVPDYASGPKRAQIEAYGAELVRILGPRSNAAEAVRRAAQGGAVYASHAYLPWVLPGYATTAYEIVAQLGQHPGTLLVPVGHGTNLLGISRGFEALQRAGIIRELPRFVGLQARACAPLWAVSSFGPAGLGWVGEGETIAEGIRIQYPVRGDAVLAAVESSGGMFLALDDEEILDGVEQLARRGFYVEPTSAIVWPALAKLSAATAEPVVAILTGSGHKTGL